MKVRDRYTKKARIEMIPLIDVIFLLLIAFIFFAMSMTIHRALPVDLPQAATAQIQARACIRITITGSGIIHVNERRTDGTALPTVLARMHREFPGKPVVISGDRHAPYETVVSVLDMARKSGITAISLDTKWE